VNRVLCESELGHKVSSRIRICNTIITLSQKACQALILGHFCCEDVPNDMPRTSGMPVVEDKLGMEAHWLVARVLVDLDSARLTSPRID